MAPLSDAEFERQAVLHAMGALSPEQARRFEAERARRGAPAERLELGVRQAIDRAGGGARWKAPSEREALAAVTGATAPQERPPWGWIATAIVLAVACASAVAWALAERSHAEDEAALVRQRAGEVDSLHASLARNAADLAARPRAAELALLLAAPNLVVAPLTGAGGAEGRLLSAPGRGVLFVAGGLAPLQRPGAYQLWRQTGVVSERITTLGDAPQGFLYALISDAAFLEGADTLLVTAESDPARLVPTEPAVLEGPPPR